MDRVRVVFRGRVSVRVSVRVSSGELNVFLISPHLAVCNITLMFTV